MATPTGSPLAHSIESAEQDFLDLVKLEHVLAGIYIWEYFTTLDIEWRFYRGKVKGTASTAWIYTLCKLSGLAYTIVNLTGLNITSPGAIDCQAWIVSRFVFATLAVMCASALVVIRITALWERHLVAVLAAIGTSLMLCAFWLRQSVLAKNLATFVPELGCEYNSTTNERPLVLALLIANFLYLSLLAGGLFMRNVFERPGWWKTLYVEGVAWLLLASCFAIPGVALLYANINGAWNQMLRGPELLIIVIGATRFYSTLTAEGSFTTYRDEALTSSSSIRPAQLEAIKFRSPGPALNSVAFEFSSGGLQSRNATGDREDESAFTVSASNKAARIDVEAAKDLAQTELETRSEVFYIEQEKTEHPSQL